MQGGRREAAGSGGCSPVTGNRLGKHSDEIEPWIGVPEALHQHLGLGSGGFTVGRVTGKENGPQGGQSGYYVDETVRAIEGRPDHRYEGAATSSAGSS